MALHVQQVKVDLLSSLLLSFDGVIVAAFWLSVLSKHDIRSLSSDGPPLVNEILAGPLLLNEILAIGGSVLSWLNLFKRISLRESLSFSTDWTSGLTAFNNFNVGYVSDFNQHHIPSSFQMK